MEDLVFEPTIIQNFLNPQLYKLLNINSMRGLNIGSPPSYDLSYNGNMVFGLSFVIVNSLVPNPPVVITAVFMIKNNIFLCFNSSVCKKLLKKYSKV